MDHRFQSCDSARLLALMEVDSQEIGFDPRERPFKAIPAESLAPPRITGYEIGGVLGEGGMGVVWRAVQLSTRRPVALKLLPLSQTQRARLRFDREVELAARLAHPHIARVYDSGASGGLSYYAMELVEGVHLDRYVSDGRLDVRSILRLMRDVCAAVHYAHQRGVIHRDLKPSNILVTPDGEPHVVDFGLAKAIEEDDSPALTREAQCPGTPGVMSPEQAAGRLDEIDTRSDVYSLGATLYLLLTGHFPHDLTGPRYQVIRRIADEEVRRPGDLKKNLPSELEWLLLKALAREPEQRYGSAEELARDIDRYLNGDALRASPPSTIYRLGKYVRKHRVWLSIAASILLFLSAATTISTWQAIRATRANAEAARQAAEALRQEANARREAETQQAINQFLNDIFASANLFSRTASDPFNGQEITVVQAIDSAVRKLDAGALKGKPEIELAIRKTVGDTYRKLGHVAPAEAQLRQAIRLSREIYGNEHAAVASCIHQLAIFQFTRGRYRDCEAQAREALAMFRKVGAGNSAVASSMGTLCDVFVKQLRLAEAQELARERVALIPEDGIALVTLAEILTAQKQVTEAEQFYQHALRVSREKFAQPRGPRGTDGQSTLLRVVVAFKNQGRYAEAEAICREVLPVAVQRLGETSMDVLVFNVRLAEALQGQGRFAEAEAEFRKAMVTCHANGGRGNPMDRYIPLLEQQNKSAEIEQLYKDQLAFERKLSGESAAFASLLTKFATWLNSNGKFVEAEPRWREILSLRRKLSGEESLDVESSVSSLGEALRGQGKTAESDALWQERLNYWQNQLSVASTNARRSECHLRMFWPLANMNRIREAGASARKCLELGPRSALATALRQYAWTLATPSPEYRDPELAVELARQAVQLRQKDQAFWYTLGVARYRAGQYPEAASDLQKSIELNEGGNSRNFFFLAMAQHRLGDIGSARQSYETALQWLTPGDPPNTQLAGFQAEAEETIFGKRLTALNPPTSQPD